MRRGEVYWARLEPRSGSEQRGRRPILVISRDAFNEIDSWHSVIVVPFSTSSRQKGRTLTAVSVAKGTAGITEDSVILCHQVTTLDRSKLEGLIGVLPAEIMVTVIEGLKAAMDLE